MSDEECICGEINARHCPVHQDPMPPARIRLDDDPKVKIGMILAKTIKQNDCLVWTGAFYNRPKGQEHKCRYPQIYFRRKSFRGNRLVWILINGAIPKGKIVCHTCDNSACINVEHLYIGTSTDNNRDMVVRKRHKESKKTHCKNGHPFSGKNLKVRNGYRFCRSCKSYRDRKLKMSSELLYEA